MQSAVYSTLGISINGAHMLARGYIIAVYAYTYMTHRYMAHCIATGADAVRVLRPAECGLCGAYGVAVAFIACVRVTVRSACAGVVYIDVMKRLVTICTYEWVRCSYGVWI